MRFYPGQPVEYWLNLDPRILQELWLAIDVIEAEEVLMQMKIADWPNMGRSQRSQFHRKIYKRANPFGGKTVSIQEAMGIINGG